MFKREDKNFIYDNPKKIGIKYVIKYCLHFLDSLWYKLLFYIFSPSDKKNYKYKVSICAIFKDEADYLKEWIEFHKIVGVEHFYLYNNNSTDNYMEILRPYIDEGLVTLKDWPKPQSQMEAYEDFFNTKSHETLWIGFIDLDEYVVPNRFDNIYDFLKKFNNRPSVLLYWKIFGSSGMINRNVDGLITEDFIVSWCKYVDIGKFFFNTKYNYSPNYKKNEYMHSTWGEYKGIHLPPVNEFGKVCTWGVNSAPHNNFTIQINHYLIKSYNEYINKKSKRGGGVHPLGMHDLDYFFEHEKGCQATDYHAYKYLVKLKIELGICN